MFKKEPSSSIIKDIASAFQKSRVLLSAYELNLFTSIGRSEKTSQQVAAELSTSWRATDRLMNALCAIGLLKKNNNRFSNTEESLNFLVASSDSFLSGLGHSNNMWKSWSYLTESVRQGKPATQIGVSKRDDKWLTSFIAAMHDRGKVQSEIVADILDLSQVSRVLDIGGGSAVFSMAFVEKSESIKATIFDLPDVIPITLSYIKEAGLSDRINTISGNYNEDNFGSGYDMIFLSSIIHINSNEGNAELIEKCSNALNPGGQIVILDFVMLEDRASPSFGALFALNMLVATDEGDTYTENEMKEWYSMAGITNIVRKDTDFGTSLIIGKKEVAV